MANVPQSFLADEMHKDGGFLPEENSNSNNVHGQAPFVWSPLEAVDTGIQLDRTTEDSSDVPIVEQGCAPAGWTGWLKLNKNSCSHMQSRLKDLKKSNREKMKAVLGLLWRLNDLVTSGRVSDQMGSFEVSKGFLKEELECHEASGCKEKRLKAEKCRNELQHIVDRFPEDHNKREEANWKAEVARWGYLKEQSVYRITHAQNKAKLIELYFEYYKSIANGFSINCDKEIKQYSLATPEGTFPKEKWVTRLDFTLDIYQLPQELHADIRIEVDDVPSQYSAPQQNAELVNHHHYATSPPSYQYPESTPCWVDQNYPPIGYNYHNPPVQQSPVPIDTSYPPYGALGSMGPPPCKRRKNVPRSEMDSDKLVALRLKNGEQSRKSLEQKKADYEKAEEDMEMAKEEVERLRAVNEEKIRLINILHKNYDYSNFYKQKRDEMLEDDELKKAECEFNTAQNTFEVAEADYNDKNSKVNLQTRGSRKSRAKGKRNYFQHLRDKRLFELENSVEEELGAWLDEQYGALDEWQATSGKYG